MLDHLRTVRAGESGYYTPRIRGTCDVWHDSKRYIYRKPASVRIFRRELLSAFGARVNVKLTGRYPLYHIDTES